MRGEVLAQLLAPPADGAQPRAVMLVGAGFGGTAAAPVARAVLQAALTG